MKAKKTTCNMQQNFSWILAGLVVGALLSTASVGRAAEDTWTRKADMPTARTAVSAAAVEGKIYAIGGSTTTNNAPGSIVEEYNPATDTWTRKADMPTSRFVRTCAVNGKIYAIGGIGGRPSTGANPLSTVEVYDPATDTWTRKSDMPTARRCPLSVVNGKIYAIGGRGDHIGGNLDNGEDLSIVEEYDPATDTWTRKTDMPTARSGSSTSVVNGKIYAIGGYTGIVESNARIFSTVEEYDPATDSWTAKTPMATARAAFATIAVNGKIFAFSGTPFTTYFSSVEEYDVATDTWTRKADIPTERSNFGAGAVGGKIYIIGGRTTGNTVIANVEEYDTGFATPSPDFNGDGIIDSADVSLMVEHWHTYNPLYDIAPAPFGDGFVDVQDLVALSEYLTKVVNDPTLAAHWALDETEGDIAYDSAGLNDASVIGGALWQPSGGQVNGAMELNGLDGAIITDPALNPADGPFSVLAWVKGGAPGQAVISQQGGANWLVTDPSEGYVMTELTNAGRSGAALLSETTITDGQWHRIGYVWDGLYRTLYVDGVAVAQDMQNNLESSSNGLYIGTGNNMQAGTFFSGLIDDVRIYNRTVRP